MSEAMGQFDLGNPSQDINSFGKSPYGREARNPES